jgi:hypothetical protein
MGSRLQGWKFTGGFLAVTIGLITGQASPGGEDLRGDTRTVGDLKVTAIDLDGKKMLPCMRWADKEGKSFYTLNKEGLVQRISFPEFKVLQQKDLERPVNYLSQSAEGLLVSVSDIGEVWLLDADSFEVKKKIPVPKLRRAVSAPGISHAVAGNSDWFHSELYVIDLKTQKVAKFQPPPEDKVVGLYDPVMTEDGTKVFTRTPRETINRLGFANGELRFEEGSPRMITGQVVDIQTSPDSKLVCVPSTAAKTIIFPIDSFQKQECVLDLGGNSQAVGFDLAAKYLYSQNHPKDFIICTMTGIKKQEYSVQPGRHATLQNLVHPEGCKVIMLTNTKAYYLEVPRRE